MVKYAFFVGIFLLVIGGTYYTGYRVGSADTKIEYIEKEVIKYVEVEKAKSTIYSSANLSRDILLRMYSENKF